MASKTALSVEDKFAVTVPLTVPSKPPELILTLTLFEPTHASRVLIEPSIVSSLV